MRRWTDEPGREEVYRYELVVMSCLRRSVGARSGPLAADQVISERSLMSWPTCSTRRRRRASGSSSWTGWKDTVFVAPGSTVRIISRFEDYADPDAPYMFHCHILMHEDMEMMGQFVIVESGQT